METANAFTLSRELPPTTGNGDGLNRSQAPSNRHTPANNIPCCKQEDETGFKPPLSVIVIQAPTQTISTPLRTQSLRHNNISVTQTSSVSAGTTSLPHASAAHMFASSGSVGQSSFRLQPRNPAMCIPSPSRSMCSRGRKRRAYSISTPDKAAEGAADASVATETTFRESSLGTPMQDSQELNSPRQLFMDSAVANLQGLSLQSPVRYTVTSGGVLESEAGSPLSLFGSQASMARSCFSKYNATSPAGSFTILSPSSPAHSSSPKLAPLTILAHNGSKASTSQLTEAAAAIASPTFTKRPPLHGGMAAFMQSLDESASRNGIQPPVLLSPPRYQLPITVHCHHNPTTPESTLSQDTVARTGETVPLPHLETPSKQSRVHLMDSPGRRSVASKSPSSTPLPKLSLTPRSTSSRPMELFAVVPLPSDLEGTLSSTEAGYPTFDAPSSAPFENVHYNLPRRQVSPRKASYIPLPDWGEPKTRVDSSKAQNRLKDHSTSLLDPPAPNDAIEQFLKVSNAAHQDDNDSLSASDDDDETFFLAAPSVIHEEKESSLQQVKQRKLRPSAPASDHNLHTRPSFASTLRASNTSLRGMNFVTSCTSLDKEGSKVGPSNSADIPVSTMHRPESQSSIGLPLESTSAPSPEESGEPSSGLRDLVTPPAMAMPKSPPPLSPRAHYLNTGVGSTLPRSVHYHSGSSPPWPCSGEVESPMNLFARMMFTSTDPDCSPHSG